MKKILSLILLLVLVVFVTSCGDDTTDPTPSVDERPATNYEIVSNFMNDFKILNPNEIVENIYLPKKIPDTLDGVIVWTSSEPNSITGEGHVTRDVLADKDVTLTAVASLGGTSLRYEYNITIKKIPASASAKMEEAVDKFYLLEDNYIDRNIMVLPRTTDLHAVYITWKTSDATIIDLDGNVYRKDNEQTVKLTATFTKDGAEINKEFNVTVGSKKDDSPAVINTDDSRIKNIVSVNSTVTFLAAINNAKPGDAIVLEDGVYNDVPVTLRTSGTEKNPIFIMARNNGKAEISGESGIEILADHVIVANLKFVNGGPKFDKGVVVFNGDYNRFTNNVIYKFDIQGNDYKWLSLTGKYHEIDRNTFDGKVSGGSLLTVWRETPDTQHHYIHSNQFLDYKDSGGANGYETIRVGTSTHSQTDSHVLIENNYFEGVNGEIEIISIKAGRTIVRNNTFKRSLGHITARHGKNSLIEGNVFFCENIPDTGGIRFYDSGHTIRNNYIEKVYSTSNTRGGIVVHAGVNEVGQTTVMNLQWIPFNVLIENNTIVDCRQSIIFDGKYAYAAEDIVLVNNLIVTSTYAALRFDKLPVNVTFINNHFYAPTFSDTGSVIKDIPTYEGISYSTTIPTLEVVNGLSLHQSFGASISTYPTSANTGTNIVYK